jgi:hypothetical protein
MFGNLHQARCGHQTKQRGTIRAFGESFRTTLDLDRGIIAYCHRCISRMAIKCACCQRPIFLGSPVAEFFNPTLSARMNGDNRVTAAAGLVICRRPSCDWLTVGRRGTWTLDRTWHQGRFAPCPDDAIPLDPDDAHVT